MDLKEKLKEKTDGFKKKATAKAKAAWFATEKFYYDHEQQIRLWAPVIVSGTLTTAKIAARNHKRKEEETRINCRHWDPRKGTYYWSKRPLRTNELLELDYLYDCGYSKGEALRRMGLLRY